MCLWSTGESSHQEGGPLGQTLLNVSAALVALAYGVLALALPHGIQKWMLHERVLRRVTIKAYGRFVESPNYVRYLRVMGILALAACALLFYSAFATASPPAR